MRMDRRPVLGLVAVALLAAAAHTACRALSSAELLEYRIKAAFICKFPSYVEWPANAFARADSPLVIGVAAPDPVTEELARTASGLSADGRPIAVRRLGRGDPLTGVQLVFIARSHAELLAETLAAAKGRPVLMVTESEPAAPPGSMINFVVVDDKVRFDIAPQVAELSNLKVSARLLGVARQLITKVS
jgi:hypothetical protein